MRHACFALSVVFLVAVHAEAAEPGSGNSPSKNPASPAAKGAAATPAAASPAPAAAGDVPPGEYYVEPSQNPGPPEEPPPPPTAAPEPPGPPPPPPGTGGVYDPPPPEFYPENEGVFEPPAPPTPHHIAPRTSLWLGVRAGVFIPFGNAWARCTNCNTTDQYVSLQGVPWRDYATSGPMFELDAGARLSRSYTVFALWERAQLGSGNGDPASTIRGNAAHGDTDFWGVAIRATSDPDRIGFVTELAVGYRRARSVWADGTELQMTDAPFEARLGLGADIRVNQFVTLSPMFSVGVGSFGKIERASNGTVMDETSSLDQADGHAWATLNFGGYFDLLGSQR